ncbi:type II toxin-antitoxin system Phd/YefM family antitoxin [Actinomycetes bacterium KLBMP 9759]
MHIPEVLSVSEFRAGLAGAMKRVSDSGPVFIGAHRKAEAVMMSVEQYEALTGAAERRNAMAEALASGRAEGLEPSPEGLELLEAVAVGELRPDEARERILARHSR